MDPVLKEGDRHIDLFHGTLNAGFVDFKSGDEEVYGLVFASFEKKFAEDWAKDAIWSPVPGEDLATVMRLMVSAEKVFDYRDRDHVKWLHGEINRWMDTEATRDEIRAEAKSLAVWTKPVGVIYAKLNNPLHQNWQHLELESVVPRIFDGGYDAVLMTEGKRGMRRPSTSPSKTRPCSM